MKKVKKNLENQTKMAFIALFFQLAHIYFVMEYLPFIYPWLTQGIYQDTISQRSTPSKSAENNLTLFQTYYLVCQNVRVGAKSAHSQLGSVIYPIVQWLATKILFSNSHMH